jgi:hypothetical protein
MVSQSGNLDVPAKGQSGTVANASSPQDTTTTSTGGSLSFQITFKNVVYTIDVGAPDPTTKQYYFRVTYEDSTVSPPATVTAASFVYRDEADWQVIASLPKALQLDTNLTINQLTIDITEGTVTSIPASTS